MPRIRGSAAKKLRDAFFDEGIALAAAGSPDADCWLCGQPIDYEAKPGSTEDSHNLDHYHTVHSSPELQEDPTNFRHSHMACNGQRNKYAPSVGIGDPVPEWW